MSAKRKALPFSKFEMASLTAWSRKHSGRNNVTKIGSFPFPRAPDRRFWKLRIISLSLKRLCFSVTCNFSLDFFDSKMKMNFDEEIIYFVKVLFFVTSLVSRIRKKTRF